MPKNLINDKRIQHQRSWGVMGGGELSKRQIVENSHTHGVTCH